MSKKENKQQKNQTAAQDGSGCGSQNQPQKQKQSGRQQEERGQ